jgi:hypothetical protein
MVGSYSELGTIRLTNATYAVLIRSKNAAAQLVLHTQAERKAATATQSGETLGAGNARFRQR